MLITFPGFFVEGRHLYDRCGKEVIPLIIGEFSHTSVGCMGEVPYNHIIAEAEKFGFGWLAWFLDPGNDDCETMDMTSDAHRFAFWIGSGIGSNRSEQHQKYIPQPDSMTEGRCRN